MILIWNISFLADMKEKNSYCELQHKTQYNEKFVLEFLIATMEFQIATHI